MFAFLLGRKRDLAGALALLDNSFHMVWVPQNWGRAGLRTLVGMEGKRIKLGQGPQRAPEPPEGAP